MFSSLRPYGQDLGSGFTYSLNCRSFPGTFLYRIPTVVSLTRKKRRKWTLYVEFTVTAYKALNPKPKPFRVWSHSLNPPVRWRPSPVAESCRCRSARPRRRYSRNPKRKERFRVYRMSGVMVSGGCGLRLGFAASGLEGFVCLNTFFAAAFILRIPYYRQGC